MSDAVVPPHVPALPPGTGRSVARAVTPRASRFAEHTPPRWFPLAVAGAGLVAAVCVVGQPFGVGFPLTVAAAAAAALPAVRVGRGDWLYAVLGGLLAVMPALRDAEWLAALDVLAILALGTLTLVGGRDWRSFLVAALSVPARVIPAPAFLARALPARRDYGPALRGAAIGAVLLLVFGGLFASADAAFSDLLGNVVPDVGLLPARVFVFGIVVVGLSAGVLAHRAPVALRADAEPRRLSGPEWLVPLVALNLLFAAFVAVQLTVLFGGNDHVLRTSGLTYAEYAVSGFYQLLLVCALTFAVVAGAVRWAPPGRLSRALLGLLLALDAVVLVSALKRLALYESAYGLSVQRVLAHAIALWLGVVLLLVVVAGVTRRAGWLPRAVVGTAASTLLVLNVINPEALVARDLVERHARGAELDTYYLAGLSADAVPEIRKLPKAERDCVLGYHFIPEDPFFGANLSRIRAREHVPATEPVPVFDAAC